MSLKENLGFSRLARTSDMKSTGKHLLQFNKDGAGHY